MDDFVLFREKKSSSQEISPPTYRLVEKFAGNIKLFDEIPVHIINRQSLVKGVDRKIGEKNTFFVGIKWHARWLRFVKRKRVEKRLRANHKLCTVSVYGSFDIYIRDDDGQPAFHSVPSCSGWKRKVPPSFNLLPPFYTVSTSSSSDHPNLATRNLKKKKKYSISVDQCCGCLRNRKTKWSSWMRVSTTSLVICLCLRL